MRKSDEVEIQLAEFLKAAPAREAAGTLAGRGITTWAGDALRAKGLEYGGRKAAVTFWVGEQDLGKRVRL
jgi:hypothetical protein